MFYGGESNVPGAPGNLLAGSPGYFPSDKEVQDRLFQYGLRNTPQGQRIQENIRRIQQQNPNVFGAPSANSLFFQGPQLGQAAPGQTAQPSYGGAPNRQLTEEEKSRLMQRGTPPPAGFREQYLPQAGIPGGFQGKYVS